jgi:SAM-dependent methyltransferase
MLKLYSELAVWWPLLSAVEDYAEEAAFFAKVLLDAGLPPSPSLLELGCGGGNNAYYLKRTFSDMVLSDLSADMLAVSRALNPECGHVQGDMRSLRLGREFDAVFVHDAIEYMTTEADLRRAMETAWFHCRAGGVALFVPDHVRETFAPSTDHGGHDGSGRGLRYLEWMSDANPDDTQCEVDMVYVLREEGQPLRVEHERHRHGLFPRATWIALLESLGFEPRVIRDAYDRELFLARKPGPRRPVIGRPG